MSLQQGYVISCLQPALPDWVPRGAQHYLAHTEDGAPIRALARAAGCHASTILRQIRKIEMRRDDPLVDAALRRLSRMRKAGALPLPAKTPVLNEDKSMMTNAAPALPDENTLSREAFRVLRRLCETGAVLAAAAEMDKAVVVRDIPGGGNTRTAVVDANVAQAMALKNWIASSGTGRIVRYHITQAGRAALAETMDRAQDEELEADETGNDPSPARSRYSLAESPLIALSRRRDKTGAPFLSDALVHAGEQLREDFELGQMDSRVTQNWDSFLTGGTQSVGMSDTSALPGPAAARARVAEALNHLGPGLSDVVLRCCCYLEGLETTEKRLGWSARSGKIVLRIALMRLKRHYDETLGPGGPLIG